ncbi:MAG: ubiquitin-conjugating enzyme E2, partial [Planctomycetales bacterium]
MRKSPRTRRLQSDLRAVTELREQSGIFTFEGRGDPPDRYVLRFNGKGLFRREDDRKVVIGYNHVVLIRLGAHYPRMIPEMKWKSPIFHPNIATNGAVCLGGYTKHWVPSLGLDELCLMLWDMIRFANYDVGNPYNRESANWMSMQKHYRLPLDHRPLRNLKIREEEDSGEIISLDDLGENHADEDAVPINLEDVALEEFPQFDPDDDENEVDAEVELPLTNLDSHAFQETPSGPFPRVAAPVGDDGITFI